VSYQHPWSLTNNILNLTRDSNVGFDGRFMFRVDGLTVMMPNSAVVRGDILKII